jgi:NDP-hexose-3-ketoreductase
MRAFFRRYGPLTHIDARFIIPPLPSANFRNHSAQGGGCLLDMGPYAAAIARLFGDGPPRSLAVVAAPRAPGLDIDVGFSLLAQFDDGVRYSGHFGFEGEYQNELLLVGKGGSIAVERVFSPPPDFTSVWQQRCANHASREEQAPADVFELFAASVIAAITAGDHHTFAGDLLRDAKLRARIADCLATES